MKISRSLLERIIKEELANRIKQLTEAPGDAPVVDADDDGKEKEKRGPGRPPGKAKGDPDNMAGQPKKNGPPSLPPEQEPPQPGLKDPAPPKPSKGEEQPPELPAEEEPADKELEDDEPGAGDDEPADITDEITGKTIQSVSIEPKSKTLPGAQEIVLTFNEITDQFKILVTKSGKIAFWFRGALHNSL